MDRAETVPASPVPPAGSGPRAAPGSLPPNALARRLVGLCGDERNLQVEFLLHLLEFDDRRAYAGAGYPSLWAYCTEVLHLREGATWRRIEAMKLLRRFPSLEAPLRDGRICLTTVNLLGPVLAEANVEELVARAAFLSKVETQRLVAALRERAVAEAGSGEASARPGSLNLSLLASAPAAMPSALATGSTGRAAGEENGPGAAAAAGPLGPEAPASATAADTPAASLSAAGSSAGGIAPVAPRAELRLLGKDTWSLRVALDDAARTELLELAALTAHSTRGDLAAVLREAVRAALARHRKRRGAARAMREQPTGRAASALPAPTATATPTPTPTPTPATAAPERASIPAANERAAAAGTAPTRPDPRAIPMAVRQAVWERDGGRCAWVSPDGKRCGSTWKLQLGHVRPVALGGQATVGDLRLECVSHNQYEAIRVFGRRHMARFQPGLDSRWQT